MFRFINVRTYKRRKSKDRGDVTHLGHVAFYLTAKTLETIFQIIRFQYALMILFQDILYLNNMMGYHIAVLLKHIFTYKVINGRFIYYFY